MAKKDADLFDRLRQVGLRKQAAKALSGVSDKTGKNAQRVARATVAELRALADEIERRLPAATPASDSSGKKNAAKPRPRATTRRSTSASAARTQRTGAAKPGRAPRSSTTPGAGRGSGSRPTPPPAASTERAAPTPDPAEALPAAGTESAAPTPDPDEPAAASAAPTPDPATAARRGDRARTDARSRRAAARRGDRERRTDARSRRAAARGEHRERPHQGWIRRCRRGDLRRAHRDRRAGVKATGSHALRRKPPPARGPRGRGRNLADRDRAPSDRPHRSGGRAARDDPRARRAARAHDRRRGRPDLPLSQRLEADRLRGAGAHDQTIGTEFVDRPDLESRIAHAAVAGDRGRTARLAADHPPRHGLQRSPGRAATLSRLASDSRLAVQGP